MSDQIISDVREARHDISEEGGHDIHKVVAIYREYQEELKRSGRFTFAKTARVQEDSVGNSGAIDHQQQPTAK